MAESSNTPPICITIRLPFVSRYICRSIRVRGRWNTPEKRLPDPLQVPNSLNGESDREKWPGILQRHFEVIFRGRHGGGWKKEGGGKPHE